MNYQTALKVNDAATGIHHAGDMPMENTLEQLNKLIPNGLAGGALAGGFMALLIGKNSTGKFVGTKAPAGSAALIGGLAYKAFKNWQYSIDDDSAFGEQGFSSLEPLKAEYQLTLIKAMIAAARENRHIGYTEQQQIVRAVDEMKLRTAEKFLIINLLLQPIRPNEIAQGASTLREKSEIYLVSCMIADPEQDVDNGYLAQLAEELDLPAALADEIQTQARQTMGIV